MMHFFRYRRCLCLLAIMGLGPAVVDADEATPAHRAAFVAAAASLATGRSADFERRRRALDAYVLAPYLDYAALRRGIRDLEADAAQRFLEREQGHQLGNQFRREWLIELARRGDWRGFQRFDDPEVASGIRHRCLRLRAGLARGDDAAPLREQMQALWATGQSLPDACDEAIAQARSQGWLGVDHFWLRLRLAVADGNSNLAGFLARQLPAPQRNDGERLARAISEPETSLKAAASWPDLAPHREAAAWALQRRARQSIDDAIGHWARLSDRLSFDETQRNAIQRELALYAAVAYRNDAGAWFQRVPDATSDRQLVEWQLRVALAGLDWAGVVELAQAVPTELGAMPRIRYWHARALSELGRGQAAGLLFQDLALEAHYHGFMAADRIGRPYALCPEEVAADASRRAGLLAQVDFQRALELQAVGWRSEAVRAWDHALRDADQDDVLQALDIAASRGWHDRAVFALRGEEVQRHYRLRFPVPEGERATVEREAASNDLDTAWVYALIRAESAWQPHARSPADAWGLMQILPATGQRMARELGIPWSGTSTLLDPKQNVRLGTRYLARQTERFEGSPWLATAAYNAGPTPVQRWLEQRGTLPADVFIETIPFHETRDYVPRILAFSVIYDWLLYGRARPLASRLPDPGQRYAGVPDLERAARPFSCSSQPPSQASRGTDIGVPVAGRAAITSQAESAP